MRKGFSVSQLQPFSDGHFCHLQTAVREILIGSWKSIFPSLGEKNMRFRIIVCFQVLGNKYSCYGQGYQCINTNTTFLTPILVCHFLQASLGFQTSSPSTAPPSAVSSPRWWNPKSNQSLAGGQRLKPLMGCIFVGFLKVWYVLYQSCFTGINDA